MLDEDALELDELLELDEEELLAPLLELDDELPTTPLELEEDELSPLELEADELLELEEELLELDDELFSTGGHASPGHQSLATLTVCVKYATIFSASSSETGLAAVGIYIEMNSAIGRSTFSESAP